MKSNRTSGPRQNKMFFTVEQEFPLWGKRDLKRAPGRCRRRADPGRCPHDRGRAHREGQVAFAQYYQADQGDPHDREFASGRARHRPRRAGPLRPGARFRSRKSTRPKLRTPGLRPNLCASRRSGGVPRRVSNALLARPIDAPLARPVKLRAPPSDAALAPAALMQRARAANPSLAGGDAQIAAAAAGNSSPTRAGIPDVMLKPALSTVPATARTVIWRRSVCAFRCSGACMRPSSAKRRHKWAPRKRGGKRRSCRSKASSANLLPISPAAARPAI